MAFLAFVEVRDMGYVVFDWEWRDEETGAAGPPARMEERLRREGISMNLIEYIKQNPPKAFRVAPVYFPTGDFLTYLLRDGPCVAEEIGRCRDSVSGIRHPRACRF